MSYLEQVIWERDLAMEQLKEHGIAFGGIEPDVVKVVRCKDCQHGHYLSGKKMYECHHPFNSTYSTRLSYRGDHYCSYGEKRR